MTRPRTLVAIAVLAGVVLVGAVLFLRTARAGERPTGAPTIGRTLRVRVWQPGGVAPTVNVNVPVVVVSAAVRFASVTGLLDRAVVSACGEHEAEACPHFRGKDIAAMWGQITSGAPVKVVDVDDGAGGRVEIRID
jgi:hypothetical protein